MWEVNWVLLTSTRNNAGRIRLQWRSVQDWRQCNSKGPLGVAVGPGLQGSETSLMHRPERVTEPRGGNILGFQLQNNLLSLVRKSQTTLLNTSNQIFFVDKELDDYKINHSLQYSTEWLKQCLLHPHGTRPPRPNSNTEKVKSFLPRSTKIMANTILDAEKNPGVDGVVDSETPAKATAAPSHKFQSRIGRLDKDMNWVSEVDWQATKYCKSSKSGETSGFVMKIDDDVDPERMILLSPYIRNVFMEIVKFYPGVDFSLDSIEMVYPYPPLYHYFADMQNFVENDKSEDRNLEDFQVLEWYYNNHLKALYNEVGSFTGLSNVSFEYLWAIFRPGDLVLTRDRLGLSQLHVLTIAELIKKQRDNYQSLPRITEHELMVKAWSVVWSPSTHTFRRSLLVFVIPQFSGSRGITSLGVYPLRFEDTSAQKKIKEELIERGNTWKKLVSKRPTCWHYKGAAFDVHDNRVPRPSGVQQLLQTINVS
jgi:hypothetical protein